MDKRQSKNEYLRRIHKVQDYIEENLSYTLVLAELADIAGFSKYHFHRIFRAITNESLLQYVNRVKLERAAFLINNRTDITITDIAYNFGFTDSAVFSRSFKKYYGLSPTQYKKQNSKKCKDIVENQRYNGGELKNKKGDVVMNIKAEVETMTMDEMRVIYIRYTGKYQGSAEAMPAMMGKLFNFAMSQNLLGSGKTKILTIYHDNPEMTDERKLRTSLCMSIPNDALLKESDDIGSMSITGKYAVGHFEIYQNEYGAAWDYMYGEWLLNSGYTPRDAVPFEVYVSDPNVNPGGKQLVDIYLPIEHLANYNLRGDKI